MNVIATGVQLTRKRPLRKTIQSDLLYVLGLVIGNVIFEIVNEEI